MEADFQTIAINGALALLIIKEVFAFITAFLKRSTLQKEIAVIKARTLEMYDWHNKSDNEGVKIWYVRRSLEDAIRKLCDNLSMQTDVLRQMVTEMKDIKKDMTRIETEIKDTKLKLDTVKETVVETWEETKDRLLDAIQKERELSRGQHKD